MISFYFILCCLVPIQKLATASNAEFINQRGKYTKKKANSNSQYDAEDSKEKSFSKLNFNAKNEFESNGDRHRGDDTGIIRMNYLEKLQNDSFWGRLYVDGLPGK